MPRSSKTTEEKLEQLGALLRKGIEKSAPITEAELRQVREMALLRRQEKNPREEKRQEQSPETGPELSP